VRVASVGEICEFKYGASLPDRERAPGDIPVYGSNGVVGRHSASLTVGPTVVIGRKGSIGKINFSEHSCWPIDTTYYVDSSCTKEDIRWLSYALTSIGLESLNKATGVPGLNRNDAYAKFLRVPPLDEQRRIAAILDQADDLRRKRREALGRLQELKTIYFERMLMSSDAPFGAIEDITESTQYGTSAKAGDEGAFPILRMGNLTYEGEIDPDDLKYIDLDPSDVEKYTVRPGDILFNRTNSAELVGKTAVVRESGYAFAGYLVRLRTNHNAHPQFVSGYLNSKRGKAILRGMCKAIIGMANINARELRRIPIPLLPLDVQRAFAARVAEIDKLKAHHRAHLARLDALFASLQHRAFRGDLPASSFSRLREKVASRSEVG
jgi:type I restriction enzyme S subunit